MYLFDSKEETEHKKIDRWGNNICYKTKKTLHHFKCNNCDKEFTRPKNGKIRETNLHFCSECPQYSLAQKETTKARVTNTIKRGKSDRGYKEIYVGDNYPYRKSKWIREHIYVMEQHIGKRIPKGMVVHHIDGNKQNNNLDNLLLCTISEHNNCHAKIEKLVFELYSKGLVSFDKNIQRYEYKW